MSLQGVRSAIASLPRPDACMARRGLAAEGKAARAGGVVLRGGACDGTDRRSGARPATALRAVVLYSRLQGYAGWTS